jgi:hypothetical protein
VGNTGQPSDTLHTINHEVMHVKPCTATVEKGGSYSDTNGFSLAVSLLNIYILLVNIYDAVLVNTMLN